jgi:hypothetical protein
LPSNIQRLLFNLILNRDHRLITNLAIIALLSHGD